MKPVVLIILDGFGYKKNRKYNAIAQANTPHLNTWFNKYPHTLLKAAGNAVGLLPGYVGNSEVGHVTIGAGRIVPQAISIIHTALNNNSFFSNQTLTSALQRLSETKKTLHIIGLLSDAGVHSHITHLYAYIKAAQSYRINRIVIHPFLDGRDSPPRSSIIYLKQLSEVICSMPNVIIGSIHGRFYAMDRNNNWQRTQACYQTLTTPSSSHTDWHQVINDYYAQEITDEFIPPTSLAPNTHIQEDDGIIFFNIRPDRAQQLTHIFTNKHHTHFKHKKISLQFFITPVDFYVPNTTILFPNQPVQNTLKEVLSNAGKHIFSIAETEKYAHVTYFFAGGKQQPFSHEQQIHIPSLAYKTYEKHPCMSAPAITTAVITSLRNKDNTDFYLINYANADMVAHSGNMVSTIKAIECLDRQLALLYQTIIIEKEGIMIITGDHGNAEDMFDETINQPRTAHTANPVPLLYIGNPANNHLVAQLSGLSNIAPFILDIMGISIPAEMIRCYDNDFSK